MSAVLIPSSLVPIARTNADWAMDIAFSGEDWTDNQVSVIIARQGLPAHAFEVTIGEGLLAPTADLAVALRIPAATWTNAPPATYTVQVRRLKVGAIDDAATFALKLEKGLSDLLTAPASAPAMSGAGDVVGSAVINRIGSVQVVRGGGITGAPGADGEDGATGLSAYEVAGGDAVWGNVGAWLVSLQAAATPLTTASPHAMAITPSAGTSAEAMRADAVLPIPDPWTSPGLMSMVRASVMSLLAAGVLAVGAAPPVVYAPCPWRIPCQSDLLAPDATRLNDTFELYLPPLAKGSSLICVNFGLNTNANVASREMRPGNSNTIDFLTLYTAINGGGVATPLAFGGATSAVMADGGFVKTDPLVADWPGGWLRGSITTPAGGKRPRWHTANTLTLSEKRVNNGAPNMTWASSGTITGLTANSTNGYTPSLIVAPYTGQHSVLALGDSMMTQDDDWRYFTSARGMFGKMARGLDDAAGAGRFGFANMANPGSTTAQHMDVTPGSGKFELRHAINVYLKDVINGGRMWPFTAIWSFSGRNDLQAANLGLAADASVDVCLAAMKSVMLAWWVWLKGLYPTVPLIQHTVAPKTLNLNLMGRTSLADQSPADVVNGVPLGLWNAWLVTIKPLPLDGVCDARSVEQANDDGTGVPKHPLTAFTLAGGGTLKAAITVGQNLNTTGFDVIPADPAKPPGVGAYAVFERGVANVEATATQVISSVANGDGSWKVRLPPNATAAKAHAQGVAYHDSTSQDGTHQASCIQVASGAGPVVAMKTKAPLRVA